MTDRGTVLQLSSMVPPTRFGGAELVVASFGEQLERAGFRVHNQGLRGRRQDGPALAIPNLYWPFDGHRRGTAQRLAWHAIDALTLSARGAVNRLVDEVRPDVIVTHNLRGWGLAPWVVARRRGIPLAHVVHDYGLLCNASTLWHDGAACESDRLPCRLRARAAIRRWPGGLLIGVSAAVLAEHRNRGFDSPGRSAVVHPVSAAQQPATTGRLRTNEFPTTYGYLGRLGEEKGIATLLDAIEGSAKKLIVAGKGETSTVAQLKSRAAAQVQWRGWMEPGQFFGEIDVLVVPSTWREPFGLVVVEAARAGVPVLIADQPGLVEAAQVSGARHRVFAAGNASALREALEVSIDEYRAEPATAPEPLVAELIGRLMREIRT